MAIGVYEGPTVPLRGPEALVEVEANRVIVATGALEAHGVFDGNDLPGVWLGRGAARLAGVHGLRPGDRVVVVSETAEGERTADVLRAAGCEVTAVRGRVVQARGRTHVTTR